MRTKITKHEFDEIVARSTASTFGRFGFSPWRTNNAVLCRDVEEVLQCVFIEPDRSVVKFKVTIGVTVPKLWPKEHFIVGSDNLSPTVSIQLGQLRTDLPGCVKWYAFYTANDLKDAIAKMEIDFLNEAIPWLDKVTSIDKVAGEYSERVFALLPTGDELPPDPFGWATYGWLLNEMGQRKMARHWFQMVDNYLRTQSAPTCAYSINADDLELSTEELRLHALVAEELACN